MDRYIDIRVLPDPEFAPSQLMSTLFAKFHRCLVHLHADDIGVSFPEVDAARPGLGAVLRIHGTDDAIGRLINVEWLTGMRDHVAISGVQAVPECVGYRRVRRVQAKSSAERIRRRQMRRHQWTEAEARERIPESVGRTLSLPYVTMESGSSHQRFLLFIDQQEAGGSVVGSFNAYGLSSSATVPWF
jgi:CRISPR-associated endonuclease Csy4